MNITGHYKIGATPTVAGEVGLRLVALAVSDRISLYETRSAIAGN